MIIKNILFFGCSYTNVYSGYVDQDKMYPSIICKHFNSLLQNYAKNGHGNYRSFDLIANLPFNEDLRFNKDSLIVLQLSDLSRIRWYDTVLKDIMLTQSTDRCLVNVYNDNFLIHELHRHLKLVVSLCRASKVKLIVWSVARLSDEKLNMSLERILNSFPEYLYMDNSLESQDSYRVDNGYDGTTVLGTGHPGPKSHSIIAQKLINKINTLYPEVIDK